LQRIIARNDTPGRKENHRKPSSTVARAEALLREPAHGAEDGIQAGDEHGVSIIGALIALLLAIIGYLLVNPVGLQ
jgi:hypothetical protein